MARFYKSIMGGRYRVGQQVTLVVNGRRVPDTIRACFYEVEDVLRIRAGMLVVVGHKRVPALLLDNHSWAECSEVRLEP